MIDRKIGKLDGGRTNVSDLIDYLNEYKDFFGDKEVLFDYEGEGESLVQLDLDPRDETLIIEIFSCDED